MRPIHSPKTINHIAISVPDLEKGMKWYQEVMGFTVVRVQPNWIPVIYK